MVIIYDSVLTEPPSSVHCFRDVTLYAQVFLEAENIIRCKQGTRSLYWQWIKNYGAHDFVQELILEGERQEGVSVGPKKRIGFQYINEYNYGDLINKLKHL
jgi:hypothetical protein